MGNINTLNKIDSRVTSRLDELKEQKAKGKKVIGYFCCYIPEEIIVASDMIPIRLCRFGDNKAASIGATYLTANACPFARSLVGLKKEGKDEYFNLVDIVADAPACMQMRRVLEVWEKYFGVKVSVISIPRQFYTSQGEDYFANSLKHFSKELAEVSGNIVDLQSLESSVRLFNDIRQKQRELYDGLKDESFPLTWEQVLNVIRAGFVLDRADYQKLLAELTKEIKSKRSDNKESGGIRLMLAGGMLAPGDEKLTNILEEVGARVVMDELCTGSRGIYGDIKGAGFNSIAKRYLSAIPCGSLPYPDLSDDPRHKHLTSLVNDYKINGVIYYTLRFCDAYTFKVGHILSLLRSMDIPFLHINSDHSTADVHQIRTRVEAFVESIKGRL